LRADKGALADLAASIADGQPVDWGDAESGAPVPDRRLVRHLRLVESIAALYRSIPAEEPVEGVPDAPAEATHDGPPWGRLILLDSIGRGTSCEVFRAWDSELHREVALKLFHDDGTDLRSDTHARVLQEARRLARVRHPNVVHVYGAEEHDKRVGLWMELVRGESLEQIVATRGTFGAREAAAIGQDLCAALQRDPRMTLFYRKTRSRIATNFLCVMPGRRPGHPSRRRTMHPRVELAGDAGLMER